MVWLLLPFIAWAQSPHDPAWRALLHYEGSRSSLASTFFISPEGQWDATAEFEATRQLLTTAEGRCRYPARAIYFGLKAEGEGELCQRWQKWREAMSAEGIEFVFAAAYMNSPSSMYGHTLLKFPRRGKEEELLDYTLNYGANTGDAGGLNYIWRGLTGGFPGFFSTAPFYLKVKEYNHVENRDFWIYPILVTPAELEILVAHAWELREIPSPYYFLRKNCSYYLLQFLEVARPGSQLTKSFPLWAVPMDTIRILKAKGWLGEGRLRASRQKLLEQRRAEISVEQQSEVLRLVENPDAQISGDEATILDTAYELKRYGDRPDPVWEERYFARRKNFGAGRNWSVASERSPEQGHESDRLLMAFGANRDRNIFEFGYRGTLHDLLSDPLGYEPSSELTMGDLRLRVEKKFFVEKFDVLRIRTVAPWELWFPRISWSFRLAYERAKEFPCAAWKCGVGILTSGVGWGAKLTSFQFFLLGELDFEAGSVFSPGYRIAGGPVGGVFFPLWKNARFRAEGEWRFRLLGEKRQKRPIRVGVSQKISDWEIRLEGMQNRQIREGFVQALYYF